MRFENDKGEFVGCLEYIAEINNKNNILKAELISNGCLYLNGIGFLINESEK